MFNNKKKNQGYNKAEKNSKPNTLLDDLCIYLSGASGDMRA